MLYASWKFSTFNWSLIQTVLNETGSTTTEKVEEIPTTKVMDCDDFQTHEGETDEATTLSSEDAELVNKLNDPFEDEEATTVNPEVDESLDQNSGSVDVTDDTENLDQNSGSGSGNFTDDTENLPAKTKNTKRS